MTSLWPYIVTRTNIFFPVKIGIKQETLKQFGSMPVLEEAKTMVYVTNHNMITMAMVIFKTYKMADKGEEGKC